MKRTFRMARYNSFFTYPLLVLLAASTLSGCKTEPAENSEKTAKPNIVRTMWPSEPNTLHPVNANSSAMINIFELTQKTLTRTDMRDLKQIPVLVKGLAEISEDRLHYTYELRDDVRWDDGSPLTVEDVIFTLKVIKCPLTDNAGRRSTYYNLKDIVKDNAAPGKFTMMANAVHFLNPYIFNEAYIIQKSFWDPKGVLDKISFAELDEKKFKADAHPGLKKWMTEFNKGENGHALNKIGGLGPYKVSQWEAGSYITLERKDNWWGKDDTLVYNHSYPEKVIFNFLPDPAGVVLKLKNRELDVVTFISTENFNELQGTKDFKNDYYTNMVSQFSFNCIAINTRPDGVKSPRIFDDVRVRRAVALLTPVEEVNNVMAQGNGERQASFMYSFNKEYYNNDLELLENDVDKAIQLLEEAGWKDTDGDNIRDKMINGKKQPLSVKFAYYNTGDNKQLALLLKDAMYKGGVNLVPDPMEFALMAENLSTHNYDLTLLALSGGAAPEDPGQIFLSKNWGNDGSNFTGFGNAQSDSLINASNVETDPVKRAEMIKRLQKLVYDQQPFIYLYSSKRKVIISKQYEEPGIYAERPGVILNNLKLKE